MFKKFNINHLISINLKKLKEICFEIKCFKLKSKFYNKIYLKFLNTVV